MWASVVLFMGAGLFVIIVLYLRPDAKLGDLLSIVMTPIVAATGGVFSFMKSHDAKAVSQETHLIVNSRFDEFKRVLEEASKLRAELAELRGVAQGAADEQKRVADAILAKADARKTLADDAKLPPP